MSIINVVGADLLKNMHIWQTKEGNPCYLLPIERILEKAPPYSFGHEIVRFDGKSYDVSVYYYEIIEDDFLRI